MKSKLSLPFIGFLQALGLTSYCSLVGIILWRGNQWFGRINNYLGPLLILTLLVVSALICALISLTYPIILFLDKKNTKSALSLVGYTALWLAILVALLMLILAL